MTRRQTVGAVAAAAALLSLWLTGLVAQGAPGPSADTGAAILAQAAGSTVAASGSLTPEAATGSVTAGRSPLATLATAIEPSQKPVVVGSDLRPGSVNRTSLDLSATYDVTARVGWSARSLLVATTITVTNTSGGAIDRLELNTIAARLGGMQIRSATVDGRAVTPTVSDQTIHLPLGGILDPGAMARVRISYRATVRSTTSGSTWLFTRAYGILEIHRWVPWISRPTPFDRPNHGDPFVTPVSPRVRVTLISDRWISWATTGEQTSPTGTTTTFEATNVRDFAVVGAPDFRRTTGTVGGVLVRVIARPGFPASTVLAAARRALSREAALLGPYPYRTYDLAQTAGGYGMESPGLTWIPTGAGSLSYLVAHETGHQWFYGIVGNDQARQPYADEAATDFVARDVLGLRRASRCSTARLDLTIYRYSSACYYEDIYIQGGNFLDDTRKAVGSAAFWAGIRDYLATYRYRIGGTKQLLDTLDAHTPLNLVTRYEPRFPSLY